MEATAQQLEQELFEMIYGDKEPALAAVDRIQLGKFRRRMRLNLEARLNSQFGATLALVEESFAIKSSALTELFLKSSEFTRHREDIANTWQACELTFEQCLLDFLQRKFSQHVNFSRELESIFILELSAGL